jgi:2,5-furandicarboxylate decarboxylase 1
VVNISAISHRRDAIYQDILADGDETGLLVKVSAEIDLLKSLKAAFPMVRRIHITLSSTLHHTILSVGKTRDADIKPLLYHMLSLPGSLFSKLIIVVDGDIDVTNPEEVEWAIASTVQADRDVLILPGLKGIPLNPCVGAEGICTNMGVDATRPLSIPAEKFERSDVPRGVKEKIEREWAQLFR